MTIPTLNVFCTDFGDVRLTDEFVGAAEARWPGYVIASRFNPDGCGPEYYHTQEPAWVYEVMAAMNSLMRAADNARLRPRVLKSLAVLAPYGVEA